MVAARRRSSMLKVRQYHRSSAEKEGGREKGKNSSLKPLDEVWPVSPNLLDMPRHLCRSFPTLTAAALGQELASALKQVDASITDLDHDENLNLKERSKCEA
jgi:cohesin loading factor subunit SCC2